MEQELRRIHDTPRPLLFKVLIGVFVAAFIWGFITFVLGQNTGLGYQWDSLAKATIDWWSSNWAYVLTAGVALTVGFNTGLFGVMYHQTSHDDREKPEATMTRYVPGSLKTEGESKTWRDFRGRKHFVNRALFSSAKGPGSYAILGAVDCRELNGFIVYNTVKLETSRSIHRDNDLRDALEIISSLRAELLARR